jgi:hypothetical protein
MKSNSPLTCAIAFAFIGGMLWLVITNNNTTMNTFLGQLTPEQAVVMERIKKIRFQIWAKGLLIGFIVALVAAKFLPISGENMNACAISAIAMGVNYFYYMLSPKSENMVSYLRPEQVPAWLEVKNMMSTKYHIGMLLGFIGSFLLAKGLNSSSSLTSLYPTSLPTISFQRGG